MSPTDRRHFLTGAAAACCGLAGCSGSSQSPESSQATAGTTPSGPAPGGASSSASSAAGGGGVPAGPTVPKADVPVGGGAVLTDAHVVVVQPEAGQYRAWTSICPHQGCDVARVEENIIVCDCHGSKFSATDGSVQVGPASSPLGPRTVSEDGDTLVVAP